MEKRGRNKKRLKKDREEVMSRPKSDPFLTPLF